MGLEFVKMLGVAAAAVIDVLLFTIVRQMIISHSGALIRCWWLPCRSSSPKKFLRPRRVRNT